MKNRWKTYLAVLCCFLVNSVTSLAQIDQSVEGEVQDTQIVIEKNREIVLPRETKVYEFIKWQPERGEVVKPETNFINYEYDQALMPIAFSPVSLPVTSAGKVYHQYAKLGYGNFGSPLVDVSLSTANNSNVVIGLNYKHLSFENGIIDGENSASSMHEISTYLMLIWEKVKLKPSIKYRNDKNYFYGYPEGTVVNREDIKRTNNYLDIGFELEDNNSNDSWGYSSDVRFLNFSDNYDNSENTLITDLKTNFDRVNLDASIVLSKYDTGSSVSRLMYRIAPYYHLSLGELEADLGVSVNGQDDPSNVLKGNVIFPYINAAFSLNDKFEVYAELDGGYEVNTMYSLAEQMPFLNPSFDVSNTQRNLDSELGLRGNVTSKFNVEGRLGYKILENMTMFVNNIDDPSLMDVRYDSSTVDIFNAGLTTGFKFNENHSLTLNLDYYGFSAGQLGEVYHRPTTDLKFKGDHLFFDKLSFQWQFNLLSGIKAWDPATDTSIALDLIPKLDLMAHYQIKDQWGAFLAFENVVSKNYSRYLNYPQRGLMFKLGATYRF
ncbi:MAG: hypothetical protein JXR07_13725 [Reichenbachiella sp.]